MGVRSQLHVAPRNGYHLVVDPLAPNWLATNEEGVWTVRQLAAGRSVDDISYRYAKRHMVSLAHALRVVTRFAEEVAGFVPPPARPPYLGRARYLRPDRLREVWLHVTDRCNLACRHCLVASSPTGADGLDTGALRDVIRQAAELGADTFYFTGGEPFLRSDLVALLRQVTQHYRATAVVLTNGTRLDDELVAALAALPQGRLHLQVSLDGSCADRNDALRSRGSFDAATAGLRRAAAAGLPVTVATVALRRNLDDLIPLASLAHELGARQLHLMWQHVRERGGRLRRAPLSKLLSAVSALADHAAEMGLLIDNVENARRIVNGDPGLKRDLTNACWDSLAVHRDGRVFPSACLVGIDSESGGSLRARRLRDIWLDSDTFAAQREQSVVRAPLAGDPLRFLHGGGDPEQAFFAGNGHPSVDPYLPLHRALTLRIIDESVAQRKSLLGNGSGGPVAYHLMGDDGYGCPMEAGVRNGGDHKVDFVHSSCVLIQDVIARTRAQVQRYYREAAREPKTEICSPVALDRRYLAHIPDEVVARSYGCGSPVLLAEPRPGETVLDLGSGAGLECFVASRLVGPQGRVIGIDMTEEMLDFAARAQAEVAARLGYGNVEFRRGYLEALPVPDASADVVISNCVINLSPEKLRVFAEIRRALKPGGRAVISDIISERPLPPDIRFNPRLRGECIAGALTERKLLHSLEKLGFDSIEVLTRAPWRVIEDMPFYSLTVRALKPSPVAGSAVPPLRRLAPSPPRLQDCLVCAAPLVYLDVEQDLRCHYCGEVKRANARCEQGHFVCDACHVEDHVAFIKSFCARSTETDPIALFAAMRRSHLFPMHGPEHHVLVPAAFLTAYRNRFGDLPQARLNAAIDRAAALPGGTCGYWGACSAALGIGVAYAAILHATPLSAESRGIAQTAVSRILSQLGKLPAPRCCRRESYLVLMSACHLSGDFLPNALSASTPPPCDQMARNRECAGDTCPLAPAT
jgi:MoaA/NifB/PqqE/SkfB family radical SAM enzyme/SAM-dependent methyltransferase